MVLHPALQPSGIYPAVFHLHRHGLGGAVLRTALGHFLAGPGSYVAVTGGVHKNFCGNLMQPVLIADGHAGYPPVRGRDAPKERVEDHRAASLAQLFVQDQLQALGKEGCNSAGILLGIRHVPRAPAARFQRLDQLLHDPPDHLLPPRVKGHHRPNAASGQASAQIAVLLRHQHGGPVPRGRQRRRASGNAPPCHKNIKPFLVNRPRHSPQPPFKLSQLTKRSELAGRMFVDPHYLLLKNIIVFRNCQRV